MFLSKFCNVLDVQRPNSQGGVSGDRYCFDKDVKVVFEVLLLEKI